jgi:hypothetical protein
MNHIQFNGAGSVDDNIGMSTFGNPTKPWPQLRMIVH